MSAKSSKGSRASAVSVIPGEGFAVEAELSVGDVSTDAEGVEPDHLDHLTLWPEDYYPTDYIDGYISGPGLLDEGLFWEPFEQGLEWGEGGEAFYLGEDQEEEDAGGGFFVRRSTSHTSRVVKPKEKVRQPPQPVESRKRSLFAHSSPIHFSDVTRVRKSAFGSIYVRTTGHFTEDAALLKTVADSSYSMLQSLLNSFEKIISMPNTDSDRKHMIMAFKESLLRALEVHGISRTFSDGSVHWNIYPISQNYLFSFQIGDRLHQTRLLSRIEERILTGPVQKLKLPYAWPTDSVWTGYWDSLGMAGMGTYNMPHGVSYNGKMQNGMFHDDDAMLTYPNQFKALHCVYEKGKLLDCQFQFPDMLMHKKENWDYCKFPDRRFWSEVRRGLKPAKIAQKTEHDPPRSIPPGCYDTSDGFFDPVSLMLVSPAGELLRVPVCEEISWIKKYCRKGFSEHANFRPDLFENWFNYDTDLIRSIMKAQANFRKGRMTYDELQRFYSQLNLLPPWAKHSKKNTLLEMNTTENSTLLRNTLTKSRANKYQEHRIPTGILASLNLEENPPGSSPASFFNKSKSHHKLSEGSRHKISTKSSKIGFKISKSATSEPSMQASASIEVVTLPEKRTIPEPFMRHQPILRPPFQSAADLRPRSSLSERRQKCLSRESFDLDQLLPPESDSPMMSYWERKALERFMRKLIMDAVNDILLKERDRHRKRLVWATRPPLQPAERVRGSTDKCLKVLEELFDSIPEKEEYCEDDPKKVWNLKEFAQDKYEVLKYWGNRIFTLDFDNRNSE